MLEDLLEPLREPVERGAQRRIARRPALGTRAAGAPPVHTVRAAPSAGRGEAYLTHRGMGAQIPAQGDDLEAAGWRGITREICEEAIAERLVVAIELPVR